MNSSSGVVALQDQQPTFPGDGHTAILGQPRNKIVVFGPIWDVEYHHSGGMRKEEEERLALEGLGCLSAQPTVGGFCPENGVLTHFGGFCDL